MQYIYLCIIYLFYKIILNNNVHLCCRVSANGIYTAKGQLREGEGASIEINKNEEVNNLGDSGLMADNEEKKLNYIRKCDFFHPRTLKR